MLIPLSTSAADRRLQSPRTASLLDWLVMTANSSPPIRATCSSGPHWLASSWPAWRSTSLPTAWPSVSLISFMLSRSARIRPNGRRCSSRVVSAASNARVFSSPVQMVALTRDPEPVREVAVVRGEPADERAHRGVGDQTDDRAGGEHLRAREVRVDQDADGVEACRGDAGGRAPGGALGERDQRDGHVVEVAEAEPGLLEQQEGGQNHRVEGGRAHEQGGALVADRSRHGLTIVPRGGHGVPRSGDSAVVTNSARTRHPRVTGRRLPSSAMAKAATPWGPAELVEELTLAQRAGDKRFASVVQLLEAPGGERLVRFAYTTGGTARRGPVTLRGRDLERLREGLAK